VLSGMTAGDATGRSTLAASSFVRCYLVCSVRVGDVVRLAPAAGSATKPARADCDQHRSAALVVAVAVAAPQTLRNFNVSVLNGKGYVEIRPRGLTKGAAAVRLINEYQR
jgi:hypothetical protein